MVLVIVSVLAVVFTVLRTWPQFIRIVVKKHHEGVSLLTWSIALANHTGWLVYGVLAPIPLFILSNLLAGAGCAATVWVMRGPQRTLAIFIGATVASVAIFELNDFVLLVLVNMTAFGMFVPQLVSVFRHNPAGVSVTAWVMASIASATWIAYAIVIGQPAIVLAHYFMLPAALIILIRTVVAPRRLSVSP